MRWIGLAVVIAIAGCMDNAVTPLPGIDGGRPPTADAPAGCPALQDPSTFPLDLGSCTSSPDPQVNVVCGSRDDGWCIEGTCRPMGIETPEGCPVCPAGEERFSTGGARYCGPQGG